MINLYLESAGNSSMRMDLCLTTQNTELNNIEVMLEKALSQISVFYSANKLGWNPTKA